jgi:hypothetical protein
MTWFLLLFLVLTCTFVRCVPVATVVTGRDAAQQKGTAALRGSTVSGANFSSALDFNLRYARAPNKVMCNIAELYGPEPASCKSGNDFLSTAQLQEMLRPFSAVWAMQKNILPHHCCMGINHMFALFTLVKTLEPAAIIESGVAAGHQTFMLRMAAKPYIPFFAIDPGDPTVNYKFQFGPWKDNSGYTKYFTGPKFEDFADINWGEVIPDPEVRAKTLVILDDHQSCVERFQVMQMWGFKWAFYEDNYPRYVATSDDEYTCGKMKMARNFPFKDYLYGDAYSPNAACGEKLSSDSNENFLYKDKFGGECTYIDAATQNGLATFLEKNMEKYYEFPPLYSECNLKRPPVLHQNAAGFAYLQGFGFPKVKDELWHYGHLFPAFIELKTPGLPLDMFINTSSSSIWSLFDTFKHEEAVVGVAAKAHGTLTNSSNMEASQWNVSNSDLVHERGNMSSMNGTKSSKKIVPREGSALGGGNPNATNRLVGAWKAVGSLRAVPVKQKY